LLLSHERITIFHVNPGAAKLMIDPFGHCNSITGLFPANSRPTLVWHLLTDLLLNSTKFSEGTKAVTFYVMGSFEQGAPYVSLVASLFCALR